MTKPPQASVMIDTAKETCRVRDVLVPLPCRPDGNALDDKLQDVFQQRSGGHNREQIAGAELGSGLDAPAMM